MAAAVETHFLSPFNFDAPMCGGPDRGPMDLTPYDGHVSCDRCQWAFALFTIPSAAVWLARRGDTVRLAPTDAEGS